ncbi:pyridoxal phosphate homeostasis protein [Nilaparvata lugens]|uniref:pyridoxal phosphate homeostasis protein n=1 Tax=Nilaparvata lugens TaxID=108931 RepID=UPI00193D7B82|nr:pyridoxal phosphate homeostasis protein [Nilaparvata lugens]
MFLVSERVSLFFLNFKRKFVEMTTESVVSSLKCILERIATASSKRPLDIQNVVPRLVAVSKTKPKELVIAAYNSGQRHFGENYIQELVEKSNDDQILEECKEIQWHFIGHLQSKKVSKLAAVKNLFVIETIDSEKLATSINNAWAKKQDNESLNCMIQVNTSGEEGKSGVRPDEVTGLASHIIKNCSNLKLIGLMTIGEFGYDYSKGPNPDFVSLVECREKLCTSLEMSRDSLELSMGMSDDFEYAIEMGSTNVRVGSSIFGLRQKKE